MPTGPAARVGDMVACPAVTGTVPHATGPIIPPGCPTVLIGGQPAARMGDIVQCVGPPGAVAMGSGTVLIGGLAAARLADLAGHGGAITGPGCPTVIIGG